MGREGDGVREGDELSIYVLCMCVCLFTLLTILGFFFILIKLLLNCSNFIPIYPQYIIH